MQAKTTKNHLLFIDGLRAIAAIFVVMHHAALQYYDLSTSNLKEFSDYHLTTVQKITLIPFFQGHYAVDLFIVLSGFSLMLSVINNGYVLRDGISVFFKRRMIRILPPYYAAVILSLIFIWLLIGKKTGTHWDVSIPVSCTDVVTHALLIHDFFKSSFPRINHSLWSIAVEFRIYFFFPLLLWLWRKYGAYAAVTMSLITSLAGIVILSYLKGFYPDIDLDYPGVSPYIMLFVFGMLAADMAYADHQTFAKFRNAYKTLKTAKKVLFTGVFLLAILLLKHPFKSVFPEYLHTSEKCIDVLVGFLSAYMLFALAISNSPDHRFSTVKILSWKPFVLTGTFSYSLYLIHPPLLQIITQYLLPKFHLSRYASFICLITVGVAFIILLSYLFFYCFERPFLKKKSVNALKHKHNQAKESTSGQLV